MGQKQDDLLNGQHPGTFAYSPRTGNRNGNGNLKSRWPVAQRIEADFTFNETLEVRTNNRADPVEVQANLTNVGNVRLPLGTQVWETDTLLVDGVPLGVVIGVRVVDEGELLGTETLKDLSSSSGYRTAEIRSTKHLIVNYQRIDLVDPRPGPHRVNVVVAAANNNDTPLDIDQEVRAIQNTLGPDLVRHLPAARPIDIVEAIRECRPSVLHFIGHSDSGALELRDDLELGLDVLAEDLNEFLADKGIQLLVLNSCSSTELAQTCLAHVPSVVGSTRNVGDGEATMFATRLYSALARGTEVGEAFDEAIEVLQLSGFDRQAFELLGDRRHIIALRV